GGVDVGGPAGGGVDGGIQQGVARPEVAGEHLVARDPADQAQVGDPADVQHRGATSLVGAQQQLVQQRGQRGPVAAGGDVGTAQVVEDGHAGGRGETARVPDLQGAEDVAVPDLVVEGLAVGGGQVGAAVGGQDPSGRGREGRAQRGMQAAPGGDVRGGRGQHGAQGIAGGGGPGLLAHVQQVGAQGGGAVRGARELDQGHVDRVQAGAGHHPQHPHEGSSASSRS